MRNNKRKNKMKKLLAIFFVLSAISTSSQAGVILSITPDSNTVDVGDDVVLTLSATTTDGSVFTNFGLDLFMNNAQLLGSDMTVAIDSMFTPFPTADFDGISGSIPPAFTPVPPFAPLPFAVSGNDITLATITIANLTQGLFEFNLGVTMADLTEGVFNADFLSAPPGLLSIDPSSFETTSVNVGLVEEVSAPAVALIMSLAAGFLLLRRKG